MRLGPGSGSAASPTAWVTYSCSSLVRSTSTGVKDFALRGYVRAVRSVRVETLCLRWPAEGRARGVAESGDLGVHCRTLTRAGVDCRFSVAGLRAPNY